METNSEEAMFISEETSPLYTEKAPEQSENSTQNASGEDNVLNSPRKIRRSEVFKNFTMKELQASEERSEGPLSRSFESGAFHE